MHCLLVRRANEPFVLMIVKRVEGSLHFARIRIHIRARRTS